MACLLQQTVLTAEQDDYVKSILVSGEHLLTVINDILDLSKIESGNAELSFVPFDLSQCIEQSIDLAGPPSSLTTIYYIDPSIPQLIIADPTRVRQILTNLVSNSYKFTKSGEVVITVRRVASTLPPADSAGSVMAPVSPSLFKRPSVARSSASRPSSFSIPHATELSSSPLLVRDSNPNNGPVTPFFSASTASPLPSPITAPAAASLDLFPALPVAAATAVGDASDTPSRGPNRSPASSVIDAFSAPPFTSSGGVGPESVAPHPESLLSAPVHPVGVAEIALEFLCYDTGCGISAEKQKKLFKPFSQADSSISREYGGTGLGLSISRRLAQLMGGTMWLKSKEGSGSIFFFTMKAALTSAPVEKPVSEVSLFAAASSIASSSSSTSSTSSSSSSLESSPPLAALCVPASISTSSDPVYAVAPAPDGSFSMHAPRPLYALVLDPRASSRAIISLTLQNWGFKVYQSTSFTHALTLLQSVSVNQNKGSSSSFSSSSSSSSSSGSSLNSSSATLPAIDLVIIDSETPEDDADISVDFSAFLEVLQDTPSLSNVLNSVNNSKNNNSSNSSNNNNNSSSSSNNNGSFSSVGKSRPEILLGVSRALNNNVLVVLLAPVSYAPSLTAPINVQSSQLSPHAGPVPPPAALPPLSIEPSKVTSSPALRLRVQAAQRELSSRALSAIQRENNDTIPLQFRSLSISGAVAASSNLASFERDSPHGSGNNSPVSETPSPPNPFRGLSDAPLTRAFLLHNQLANESVFVLRKPLKFSRLFFYLSSHTSRLYSNLSAGSSLGVSAAAGAGGAAGVGSGGGLQHSSFASMVSSSASTLSSDGSSLAPPTNSAVSSAGPSFGTPRQSSRRMLTGAAAFGSAPSSISTSTAQPTQRVADLYPLSIALAEDNSINRKLLLKLLEKMGYVGVKSAVDGLALVELVKKSHYDLIFMDVQMPECDGLTATRAVRKFYQDSSASRPLEPIIIAMTGMSDYISKPIDFGMVLDRITFWGARIVQMREATRADSAL